MVSLYMGQIGLELIMILLQSPGCWDCNCEPSCPEVVIFMSQNNTKCPKTLLVVREILILENRKMSFIKQCEVNSSEEYK